jgi:hypothetical protein
MPSQHSPLRIRGVRGVTNISPDENYTERGLLLQKEV